MQHKAEDERRWDAQSNATSEMQADIKLLLREVSEIGAHVQNLKTIDE
jgi:hypothetical protein